MTTPSVPDVSPDVPTPTWRLILRALGRLPARGMSRGFGRIADLPIPRGLRATLLGAFAGAVGIDLSEAELPLEAYPTLNALFVRRLGPGARSWPADAASIASPVDGVVGQSGRVEGGLAIQAKGHAYSVADLVNSAVDAKAFRDGSFLTIYLSPRHYHRIHTPCAGEVRAAVYVPGALLPVNAPAVMHVPGLFVRNERLVAHLDTPRGPLAVVAVGAYNVGRISAAFDPTWGSGKEAWVTNRVADAPLRQRYNPPRALDTGDELMAFHLGSTVVLLFAAGVELRPHLTPGTEVRVGERLDVGQLA